MSGEMTPIDPTDSLSAAECSALAAHEATIERYAAAFFEVGRALAAIRDDRLYRAVYGNFEAYLAGRWGIGRARGYQLIDAAMVRLGLEAEGLDELPANERQSRPLAALPAEEWAGAWAEVVATAPPGRLPEAHVRGVVDRRLGRVRGPEPPKPAVVVQAEYERDELAKYRSVWPFRPGSRALAVAEADARRWLRSEAELGRLADNGLGDPPPRGVPVGPFGRALARLLGLAEPERWDACPACDDGRDRSGADCGKCRGAGVRVPEGA